MKTLIFDTETTGLVNHKSPDHSIQPWPVQIACILVCDNKIVNSASIIVNPGVPISEEAANIHGITQEMVDKYGLSMKAATGLFINFLNLSDRLVAHNIDFDLIVTEAMIYRALADYDISKFREKGRVCTMHSTTNLCRLPGKYGKFKWPKLEEAYKMIVDPKGFEGAHDAMIDVIACWKVLQKLEEKGLPLLRGQR